MRQNANVCLGLSPIFADAVNNAVLSEYAYQYDDIGNRLSSLDLGTNRTYVANSLNQYTLVGRAVPSAPQEEFAPQFDEDGNQTLIQTSTGIWSVTYNGENRPVLWECGSTNITMKFDRMGRRVEYVESVADSTGGPGSVPASGDTTTWIYDEATGILLAKAYADGHGPT